MVILALDLAKNKSVACFYDVQSQRERYVKVPSSREALLGLLAGVAVDRVVLEVGTMAGWVYDLFVSQVAEVQVANPNGEAWQWRKVKTKTDRKDALKLAQMSAWGQLPTVHMPAPAVRQRRAAVRYRRKLIARRTAIKNSIRALLLSQGLHLPSGKKGWSQECLAHLGRLSAPVEQVDVEDLWRGCLAVELQLLAGLMEQIQQVDAKMDALAKVDPGVIVVTTITGVGNRLGEALSAFLDAPERFASGRQVSSYLGLVPKKWESGQMSRNGHITKAGNADLRALLVEATWLALRYNPWLREVYSRVYRGDPKRRKVAIVAAARHLLVTAWAMLRDGTVWKMPRLTTAEPPVAA